MRIVLQGAWFNWSKEHETMEDTLVFAGPAISANSAGLRTADPGVHINLFPI
jgi:hypothetical protein